MPGMEPATSDLVLIQSDHSANKTLFCCELCYEMLVIKYINTWNLKTCNSMWWNKYRDENYKFSNCFGIVHCWHVQDIYDAESMSMTAFAILSLVVETRLAVFFFICRV